MCDATISCALRVAGRGAKLRGVCEIAGWLLCLVLTNLASWQLLGLTRCDIGVRALGSRFVT